MVIAERAANLVQIRTQKYKQWMSDEPDDAAYSNSKEHFLRNRIHVKLESLSPTPDSDEDPNDLQKRFVGDALNDRCVPIYNDFKRIITKQKWDGRINREKEQKAYDVLAEKKELLSMCIAQLTYALS
jgi:hypothetical protein